MKKLVLLLTCSVFAVSAAKAMDAAGHLNAVKDIFSKEFQKIDLNGDGAISADEYMLYQLETLQNSLNAETQKVEAEATAMKQEPSAAAETPQDEAPKAEEPRELNRAMSDTTATLEEMANFSLDTAENTAAEPDTEDEEWYLKPEKLTMEDVMPEDENAVEEVPEIDLTISEDESLKNILADMAKDEAAPETPSEEEKTAADAEKENKQLQFMLDTIRKTLPKKIDNITTWTAINYRDNEIDYFYKSDVDINKFSTAEKAALKGNIEKVACAQASTEMCPTIKPMFIDKGVNMKIRYYDKADIEISDCTFNNDTCK